MSIFIAKFSRSGFLVWLKRTGSAFPDVAISSFYFGAVVYVTGATNGNMSSQASATDKSTGIEDGFVLAYDSFTGRRKWVTQIGQVGAMAQIATVSVSSVAGILVSGRTNASLSEASEANGSEEEVFVARLSHVNGRIEKRKQHRVHSTVHGLIPRQMITTIDNKRVHIVVEVELRAAQKESYLLSLQASTLNLFSLQSIGSKDMKKVSEGLAEDTDTRNVVVSYSVSKMEGGGSWHFGLETLSSDVSATGNRTMAIAMFPSSTDGICKGVVLNSAGYAFMLGMVSTRGSRDTRIGVWVYDLRDGKTVGLFQSKQTMDGSSMRVAGVTTDGEGAVVFAGVRVGAGGKKEVMLGTFGVPQALQTRTEALELEGDGGQKHTLVGDVNGAAIETVSEGGGLFARGADGKLETGAIAVIGVAAVGGCAVVVVGVWCLVRVRRRGLEK